MYLCSSYCLLCMFQFQIYRYTWFTVVLLISLILFVNSYTCILGPHHLIMYTYTCYARHLALLYVLIGLRLTTLDSHVQIKDTGPWWPYYSWSEYAADSSMTVGAQQMLGLSSQLFLLVPLLLLLVSTSQLMYISSYDVLLYFWWCNIPVILYLSVITMYLCYFR